MLSILTAYRIKASIWFRQMYMPGIRGAAAILLINLLVALTIKIAAWRIAKLALQTPETAVRPIRRRVSYVSK